MTNPNCGICGNLNARGFCNFTTCILPSNKTEAIQAKKPTNADRIRSMTDKELANMWFLYVDCGECPMHMECNMLPQDCLRLALEWLKQESGDV